MVVTVVVAAGGEVEISDETSSRGIYPGQDRPAPDDVGAAVLAQAAVSIAVPVLDHHHRH